MTLSSVIVTGHWVDADGGAAQGMVAFTPVTSTSNGEYIVTAAPVYAMLDNGSISESLINDTDVPDLQYQVVERIIGQPLNSYVITPTGSAIDLNTIPRGDPIFALASTIGQPNGLATLDAQGQLSIGERVNGGSGTTYIYQQSTAASQWTIVHNLGYPPHGITVITDQYGLTEADIAWPVPETTVVINFNGHARSGVAYL